MDIITAASAVGSGIIVAVNRELRDLTAIDFGDDGHEIVGDAIRVFTEETGRVIANGVEISQSDGAKIGV